MTGTQRKNGMPIHTFILYYIPMDLSNNFCDFFLFFFEILIFFAEPTKTPPDWRKNPRKHDTP